MSKAALEKLKKTYFGRVLHAPTHGYVMGDVPVAALAEVVRDYEALQVECEKLRKDVSALVEALSALRGCIMETRGPDAHSALELADAALAAYRKGASQ